MKLHHLTKPADTAKHKCLALSVFADERPPRGICGYIDWRLNGFVSREIKAGKISGEFGKKTIIPFPARLDAEYLLFFGMGKLSRFNLERINKAARQLIAAVDGLLISEFSFELPAEKRITAGNAEIMEAVVTGFFDYLSEDADKLNRMVSCIVTQNAGTKEISAGIKSFKSKVKDLGTVKFSL
ncbi:MAG TPA: hypothetical protein ENN23_06665 [Deltaproteobacteria bacterium]|nr:hypothetical protein [Deltaproteobacteria bacterium]